MYSEWHETHKSVTTMWVWFNTISDFQWHNKDLIENSKFCWTNITLCYHRPVRFLSLRVLHYCVCTGLHSHRIQCYLCHSQTWVTWISRICDNSVCCLQRSWNLVYRCSVYTRSVHQISTHFEQSDRVFTNSQHSCHPRFVTITKQPFEFYVGTALTSLKSGNSNGLSKYRKNRVLVKFWWE